MLYLDIETRSQCDLLIHGLERYAQDPTTQLICFSYAFDEEPVELWFAEDGEPFPQQVIDHFNANGLITAHNAAFERLLFDFVISNDYDFTAPDLRQWRCSSARATAHGLPASLADIGHALELPIQKQTQGYRLIRDYCAPHFKTQWYGNDKELMGAYCSVDTEVMRQICSKLRELTAEEWEQYHITQEINDRGVPIDMDFANAAKSYGTQVKDEVNEKISRLTLGDVTKSTARNARDAWLVPQLNEEQIALLTVTKGKKTSLSFDKNHRAQLASYPNNSPKVATFLELLEEAGGSSISKYSAMVNLEVKGRVHHSLIWNGAGATGRYSSKGLQLQNFRRDVMDNADEMIEQVVARQPIKNPADVLGRLTRAAIYTPEGLSYSDYSQIEARVLPWITKSEEGDEYLDIFREGRDVYVENAKDMFNVAEVSKNDRQAAKVGVLACGFGGGAGAVQAMAKIYGMVVTETEAETIKNDWRNANQWAVDFWYAIKRAAKLAVETPNNPYKAGRVTLQYDGSYWLWMALPSGRFIAYADPQFEEVTMPWGDTSRELTVLWGGGRPKAGAAWPRRALNHLILTENAVQACAADLMREAIVRAHQSKLDVLFSVHDELICVGNCTDKLHKVMVQPPTWASGLPIGADTEYAQRYGK